jgi:hypothetical protein
MAAAETVSRPERTFRVSKLHEIQLIGYQLNRMTDRLQLVHGRAQSFLQGRVGQEHVTPVQKAVVAMKRANGRVDAHDAANDLHAKILAPAWTNGNERPGSRRIKTSGDSDLENQHFFRRVVGQGVKIRVGLARGVDRNRLARHAEFDQFVPHAVDWTFVTDLLVLHLDQHQRGHADVLFSQPLFDQLVLRKAGLQRSLFEVDQRLVAGLELQDA